MPIYEFKCDECGAQREIVRPISESGLPLICECERVMRRKFSVTFMPFKQTGRDQVLASLNSKDDGLGNKPHIKAAMWKGLNQR